jgi:hypothetical protein
MNGVLANGRKTLSSVLTSTLAMGVMVRQAVRNLVFFGTPDPGAGIDTWIMGLGELELSLMRVMTGSSAVSIDGFLREDHLYCGFGVYLSMNSTTVTRKSSFESSLKIRERHYISHRLPAKTAIEQGVRANGDPSVDG